MSFQKKQTARGFTFYEFFDTNRIRCTLQKSSSGNEPKIWLGVDSPSLLNSSRMHLTVEKVRMLIPLLQKFVKEGEI